MPVITFSKKDLLNLMGEEIEAEELKYSISMIGTDLDEFSEEITVEIFPDRPDMLSVEGLARALEGFLGIKTGLEKFEVHEDERFVAQIEEKVKKVRPAVVCAVVKDVELSDEAVKSLMQIQEKLHITHGRDRRRVSIGIHDLDKITFPVTYTTKPPEFSFIPLESFHEMSMREILSKHKKGKEYAHLLEGFSEYPVWIDSQGRVLSMPPIINSEDTKVEEKTKHLFLDVTGLHEKSVEQALNILVAGLHKRGGRIFKTKVFKYSKEMYYPRLAPLGMSLDLHYTNKLLGLSLSKKEVKKLLEKMRFGIDENLNVKIPAYRADILHPIDLVEDVGIAFGFDNFLEEIPEISTIGEESPKAIFERKIASLMVGFGLLEVKNYILSNKKVLFERMNLAEEEVIETRNALTSEYDTLRSWLLPMLLKVYSQNKHNTYPQNIFELGEVVIPDEHKEEKTREEIHLACGISHPKATFTEAKEILSSFFLNLGEEFELLEDEHPSFIYGRCGAVLYKGKKIGIIGEIHPQVLFNWELSNPVSAFEIDLEDLI